MKKNISAAEPVSDLRRIPIRECGEPLVNFMKSCPELQLDPPRFNYTREMYARKGLAERLCWANEWLLKQGYRLSIIECWRAPHIQRRMYLSTWERFRTRHPDWSNVQLKRVVNRFTAPLHGKVPPPHTTGGAVDLLLATADGKTLDHQGPYEAMDPRSFAFDAPNLSDEARSHRDMLKLALEPVGITNYPSEYWHWSYGDQGWAYRGGDPTAFYGPITPTGWQPNKDEDIEEPLIMAVG